MRISWIFIFLCFQLSVYVLDAQELSEDIKIDETEIQVQKIEKEDLENYHNDSDFNYTQEKVDKTLLDRFFTWLRNGLRQILEAIFGVGNASGILYFIFNVLPYVILALLVLLLVRFFLRVNSRNVLANKQNSPLVQFTEEEQIIKSQNIKALISEAIKQKNFRLAIRYYYLLTLKTLSEKGLIEWEQQKTNNDYITEIKKDDLKSNFEKITLIYDYVWYGEFAIDATRFSTLQSAFELLNKNIHGNK